MRQKELLKLVHLSKGDLHFWERQGYIRPRKVLWGRRTVRDYSARDARLLRQMLSFTSLGLSPAKAFARAVEETRTREQRRIFSEVLVAADRLPEITRRARAALALDAAVLCSPHAPVRIEVLQELANTLPSTALRLSGDLLYQFADDVLQQLVDVNLAIDIALSVSSDAYVFLGALCALSYQRSSNRLTALSVRRDLKGSLSVDSGALPKGGRALLVETILSPKTECLNLAAFLAQQGARLVAATGVLDLLPEEEKRRLASMGCVVFPLYSLADLLRELQTVAEQGTTR
jgi:DNA-binding transcriptional MerR regulator/orotate phosphoribosyltransferase